MILILIFDYSLDKNCHRLGGNHETVSLCFGPWRFREATLTASSGTGGPSVWRETNLWKLSFHMASICTKYAISKNIKICFCLRYIYIYILYIYTVCIYIIYIYLFVNVPYIRWTVAKLLLYYSHLFYPLAIQHPGVVDSHHVSYVNHWTKWHCCQIARGFLHLRCGLCDDLGMPTAKPSIFSFPGKKVFKNECSHFQLSHM